MGKKYSSDFKDCYFALLELYGAVDRRIMYNFLKDMFEFKRGETAIPFKSLRVQILNQLDDEYKMKERREKCPEKFKKIFNIADSLFNIDTLIDDMASGKLRDEIESVIADKDSSIAQLKIGEAKMSLAMDWRNKKNEILGTDKPLVTRVIDELNMCKDLRITTMGKTEEFKLLVADYFSANHIKIYYIDSEEKKKSSVIEVKKIVDISGTLREKNYICFIDNLVIIRIANRQFLLKKETEI